VQLQGELIPTKQIELLAELLQKALQSLRRNDGHSAESILASACNLARSPTRPIAIGGFAPWQATRIENFCVERINGPITLTMAAAAISRSPSHFCRAFRATFGCSFSKYVVRLRLTRACTLMLTTSMRLSEIALESGLADQAHLCRTFRRIYGESPAAWRRLNRHSPSTGEFMKRADCEESLHY
jgi:AraC-like DNA-binding protein